MWRAGQSSASGFLKPQRSGREARGRATRDDQGRRTFIERDTIILTCFLSPLATMGLPILDFWLMGTISLSAPSPTGTFALRDVRPIIGRRGCERGNWAGDEVGGEKRRDWAGLGRREEAV